MSSHSTFAALVALLLGLSGCFFTEVINEAPVAGIRVLDTGPYFIGDTVRFNATKSVDDTQNRLQATWQAHSCSPSQTPRCTKLGAEVQGDIDTVFSVELTGHESIEVQLRVVDDLGATRLAPDLFTLEVGNRNPAIKLQVTGSRESLGGSFILPLPINLILTPGYEELEVFDPYGDELSYEWELLPPAGSQSVARSFEPMGELGYVLRPDVSGTWAVVVKVDDGHGGTAELRENIFVATDSPPCIGGTDPLAVDEAYYLLDGPRRFSVLSVQDTLDPFPTALDGDGSTGEAQFRWLLKEPGASEFTELVGYGSSDYLVDPSVYNPGETLLVRVEVSDRVVGPERELGCGDELWRCELEAGQECYQRMTWGVDIR